MDLRIANIGDKFENRVDIRAGLRCDGHDGYLESEQEWANCVGFKEDFTCSSLDYEDRTELLLLRCYLLFCSCSVIVLFQVCFRASSGGISPKTGGSFPVGRRV